MTSQKTKYLAGIISGIFLLGCGGVKTGKRGGGGDSDDADQVACGDLASDESPTFIRLKGTSLLAQSLEYALGPGKDININSGEERLLETYSSNFGNTQGLSFGEIYSDIKSADIKMTGYMMGLNIVAYNAALRCASSPDEEKCLCGSEESAAMMLRRAAPYMQFCESQDDAYVTDFAALCAEDSISAITALFSSTAFAMRN